jgi:hypothetical protein
MIGLHASRASALRLTFDDSLSVGWFDPCGSRLAAAVVACIDHLMIVSPKGGNTPGDIDHDHNGMGSTVPGSHSRSGNADALKDDLTDDVSDLLGKHFPRGHVWLISGFTPNSAIATSLSPGEPDSSPVGAATVAAVPDLGSTAMLLGFSLVAIRFLKRRFD